jgi:hypothetical protein
MLFEKYNSRVSKIDIIFAHTYRYSKGTVEILEINMSYFELHKKTNFYKCSSLYIITNLSFSIVRNTMQFPELEMNK